MFANIWFIQGLHAVTYSLQIAAKLLQIVTLLRHHMVAVGQPYFSSNSFLLRRTVWPQYVRCSEQTDRTVYQARVQKWMTLLSVVYTACCRILIRSRFPVSWVSVWVGFSDCSYCEHYVLTKSSLALSTSSATSSASGRPIYQFLFNEKHARYHRLNDTTEKKRKKKTCRCNQISADLGLPYMHEDA